jgi:glycosyltransferase involved in cell wall biosynthesis
LSSRGSAKNVSVVIGAYNAAAWIGQALDSVLAQSYPVLEVLVIDDGSSDDTARLVKSYGGIVTYLQEKHRGRPYRNRGILAANGDFVSFIDADDYWHPKKIELQMDLLLQRGAAWSICEAQWLDSATDQLIDSPGPPIPDGDILEALFLKNFIVASAPVVRRQVFEEVGYFRETPDTTASEDWDLWLRIAARFPVACVRQRLATVRLHTGSFLARIPPAQKVQVLEGIVERAASREPGRLSSLRNKALANIYYSTGVGLFRQQRLTEGRSYFLKALRKNPGAIASLGYIVLALLGPAVAKSIVGVKRQICQKAKPAGN